MYFYDFYTKRGRHERLEYSERHERILYLHQTQATGKVILFAYEIINEILLNGDLHYEKSSNSGALLFFVGYGTHNRNGCENMT